jgi:hypothetical protein
MSCNVVTYSLLKDDFLTIGSRGLASKSAIELGHPIIESSIDQSVRQSHHSNKYSPVNKPYSPVFCRLNDCIDKESCSPDS